MMSNILFIGDLHLKANSPVSRKDQYPTAILNKILYLASVSSAYNCKTFILLGDVFDSPITSLPYLAEVIDTFKKVAEYGVTVYTIVGNHDIKNNRMDSLPSTALGILISTGYVKLAEKSMKIDSTVFRFFNYPETVECRSDGDYYEVCVAHLYYEFSLANDSLCSEDLKRLNYNAMILGHYHVPCDTITVENTLLYRPGSLSRSTSEPYNKLRTPRALLFNCTNHKAAYIEVACAPAEEVFVNQVEGNNQTAFSMKDLIQFITTSYSSSDMNVREYFGSLQIPYECREKIAKYLDSVGA
jgi:DNA repair exonuclease SbcCD nuclease subunit